MNHNIGPKRRNRISSFLSSLPAGILAVTLLATDFGGIAPSGSIVGDAEARVGRPLTPVSFAGVARRTVRRSAVYISTLPAACVRTTVSGVVVWKCGGTYYQAYRGRYVVVYVN